MTGFITIAGVPCEWHTCITCGVVYTIPKTQVEHQRKVGGFHTCCNGHSQGWNTSESEDAHIRRERDRLKQQIAQKDDEIAAERRRTDEVRKTVVKLQKRAKAGVCPCCNRSVRQMALHMKTKHPEFKAESVA